MFGGIEAGRTKFVCGIGTGPDDLKTAQFPTSTPDITVASVIDFFKTSGTQLDAIGIGSFGPVDLDPKSAAFRHTTSTPKPSWENFNLLGAIQQGLGVPAALDTDVTWRCWESSSGARHTVSASVRACSLQVIFS